MMSSSSRVVFGGAPTLEEAKEATSELKDALDRIYLPSTSDIGWLRSSPVVQVPAEGYSDSKACFTAERGVASSPLQTLVSRAFSLLNASPDAQNAVASIVSDQNVWNAVIQNSKVMEFLRLRSPSFFLKRNLVVTEAHSDTTSDDEYQSCISDNEFNENDSGNWITILINQIKITIVEMLKGISGLFDIIFKDVIPAFIMNGDGKPSASNAADRSIGATFMVLGVIAIFMVVVKRSETAVAVQLMNQQNLKYINFLLKTTPTKYLGILEPLRLVFAVYSVFTNFTSSP